MSARISSPGRLRLLATGVIALTSGGPAVTMPVDPTGPSASAITLVDVMADRIYQRVGTSKDIGIAGSYTGTATIIEARAVSVKTGTAITNWMPMTLGAGNTYAGLLNVPQGGVWCKLQVRDGVNHSITANGVNQFGVGKIVAPIGQSNMAHMYEGVVDYLLSDPRARTFINGKWDYVGNCDPTGTLTPGAPAFGGGGWAGNPLVKAATPRASDNSSMNGDGIATFVNAMTASLGILVGTLEYAVGGSNIDQWQTGGVCWQPFAAAVAACGGDFEEVIWYQGESKVANYTAKLANVLSQCRTLVGRNASNLAFGVVTLGPCDGTGGFSNFGPTRAEQIAFIANTPGVYLAGVAGDSSVPTNDTVHIDNASRVRMAKRYSKSSKAYADGAPKPGPHITGASRSARSVVVATAGGTGALKGGAGGNGSALAGFRFTDNNGAVAYSSSLIVGNNIQITLAADPVGPLSMDFGMADLPYGAYAPPPDTIVYDSDTVPGDTLGLPLQPCAAFTVTGS